MTRTAATAATVAVTALGAAGWTPAAPRAPRCPATAAACAAAGSSVDDAASFDHGTARLCVEIYWPHGTLVAGRLPGGGEMAHVNPGGSISAKVGWWRRTLRPLSVRGRRLDGPAPPLRADVAPSSGYGAFLPSILTFPATGCWRVVGSVGRTRLSFVVRVTRGKP